MLELNYFKSVFSGFILTVALCNPYLSQTVYSIRESEFHDTLVSTICNNCVIERELKNEKGKVLGVTHYYLNDSGKRDSVATDTKYFLTNDKYVYKVDTTHVYRDGKIKASFTSNSSGDSIRVEYKLGKPIVVRRTVFNKSQIKRVEFYDYKSGELRKKIKFVKRFNGKRIEKVKSYDNEELVKRSWIYKETDNSFTVFNDDGTVRQSLVLLNDNIIRYFWFDNTIDYYTFEEGVLKSIYSYKNGVLSTVHEYKVLKKY